MKKHCLIINIKTGTKTEHIYLGEDKDCYYYKDLGRGKKSTLVLDKSNLNKKIFIEG